MRHHQLLLLLCCAIFALSGCAPATPPPPAWDLVLAAPAGDTADAAQAAADAYAQATGLRVQVQTFPDNAYGDRVSAVLLAGTSEFDLVYLSAESLPKWVDYHTLQPLNLFGVVDENNAAWVKLTEVVSGEGIAVWGVPVEPDVDVLWYRSDVFEAAGISPHNIDTFDVAFSLQMPTGWPVAIAAGELDAGRDVAALSGSSVIDRNGDNWTVWVEVLYHDLVFYQRLQKLADPNSKNWTRADVQKALATDQAAMGILPLSSAGELLDCERSPDVCADGEPLLAFAPLPGMEETMGVGSVQAWVVPLKAPHLDAASAFAAWLATEEGARAWARGGGLPAHRAVLAEMDSPAAQALSRVGYFLPAFPPLIPAEDIWRALHAAGHQGPWRGGPDPAVREAVDSIKTALRKSGYTVIEE